MIVSPLVTVGRTNLGLAGAACCDLLDERLLEELDGVAVRSESSLLVLSVGEELLVPIGVPISGAVLGPAVELTEDVS